MWGHYRFSVKLNVDINNIWWAGQLRITQASHWRQQYMYNRVKISVYSRPSTKSIYTAAISQWVLVSFVPAMYQSILYSNQDLHLTAISLQQSDRWFYDRRLATVRGWTLYQTGFIPFFRNRFPGLFQDSDWYFKGSKIHINPCTPKISMLILLTAFHTLHIF